jgi:hypothetical protein
MSTFDRGPFTVSWSSANHRSETAAKSHFCSTSTTAANATGAARLAPRARSRRARPAPRGDAEDAASGAWMRAERSADVIEPRATCGGARVGVSAATAAARRFSRDLALRCLHCPKHRTHF